MLDLTAKLDGQNAAISLGEDATVADLQAALTTAFGLAPGTAMRILNKGKAVKDATSSQLSAVGVSAGTKLMVMASRVEAIKEVEEAKPERMRGFSEDDLRTRTGSSGGSSHVRAASTSSAASPFKFHGLRALPVLPPGAGPPVAAAEARLKELSTDPGYVLTSRSRARSRPGSSCSRSASHVHPARVLSPRRLLCAPRVPQHPFHHEAARVACGEIERDAS